MTKSCMVLCTVLPVLLLLCVRADEHPAKVLSNRHGLRPHPATTQTPSNTPPFSSYGLIQKGSRVKLTELTSEDLLSGLLPAARSSLHVKATLLSVLVWTLLGRMVFLRRRYDVQPLQWYYLGLAYCFYLLEALFSSTRRYLSHPQTPKQALDHLRQMQNTRPSIQWQAECYHYRRGYTSHSYGPSYDARRRFAYNHTGPQHARSSDSAVHKVVTYRTSRSHSYRRWSDHTMLDALQTYLEQQAPTRGCGLVKLTSHLVVTFDTTQALLEYQREQLHFWNQLQQFDHFCDLDTTLDVPGLQTKQLVVCSGLGRLRWAKLFGFWFWTVLGGTVPYRIWLHGHSESHHVLIHKSIS